jgi:hypothetical protein
MGFIHQLDKDNPNSPLIMVGYSIKHICDPFKGGNQGDAGENAGAVSSLLTWHF